MYSNMSDLCPTPIGLIGPSGCNCTIDTTKGIVVVDKQTPYNTTYRVPPGRPETATVAQALRRGVTRSHAICEEDGIIRTQTRKCIR